MARSIAGQKAFDNTSEWLPEKTIEMFDEFGIGIKGPLTTQLEEELGQSTLQLGKN